MKKACSSPEEPSARQTTWERPVGKLPFPISNCNFYQLGRRRNTFFGGIIEIVYKSATYTFKKLDRFAIEVVGAAPPSRGGGHREPAGNGSAACRVASMRVSPRAWVRCGTRAGTAGGGAKPATCWLHSAWIAARVAADGFAIVRVGGAPGGADEETDLALAASCAQPPAGSGGCCVVWQAPGA